MVELRNILAGIVDHINKRLEKGDQLRVKIPAEVNPPYFSIRLDEIDLYNSVHWKPPFITRPVGINTIFYHNTYTQTMQIEILVQALNILLEIIQLNLRIYNVELFKSSKITNISNVVNYFNPISKVHNFIFRMLIWKQSYTSIWNWVTFEKQSNSIKTQLKVH